MKKRIILTLAALFAVAAAVVPARAGLLASLLSAQAYIMEITSPASSTPDNLVRRYKAFRTEFFSDMPQDFKNHLSFPWPELVIIDLDQFSANGEGDWTGDLADAAKTINQDVCDAVWYPLWVYERVDEDGARQWVVSARDATTGTYGAEDDEDEYFDDDDDDDDEDVAFMFGKDVGEELYTVDVDADYNPYQFANAYLKYNGLAPTRDAATCDFAGESSVKRWVYNIADPARFRMKVTLIEPRDYFLFNYAMEHNKKTSGGGNSGGGGGGNGGGGGGNGGGGTTTNAVEIIIISESEFEKTSVTAPLPFEGTNALSTTGFYGYTFACTNPATQAVAHQVVVNNDGPATIILSPEFDGNAYPTIDLVAHQQHSFTNLPFSTSMVLTVSLSGTPSSTNSTFRINWKEN